MLESNVQQRADDIVQVDQFQSTVSPFHPRKSRELIIVDRNIQRSLICTSNLLGDVVTTEPGGRDGRSSDFHKKPDPEGKRPVGRCSLV